MARLKKKYGIRGRGLASGLGYSAGDIIGPNVDPGWSGPAMRIVSLGSGTPVHWNTGGSANVWLPPYTKLEPVTPNGWIYELQPDGQLNSTRTGSGPETNTTWDPPAPTDPPGTHPGGEVVHPPAGELVPWKPPPAAPPVHQPPMDPEQEAAAAAENDAVIPVWVWILGAAAALYFLSDSGRR